jgi:regulator of replication initiation timing
MLGKDLEAQLGIKQQYRSRYDKMFSAYISPATKSPREYSQSDVNAYVIIVDCFAKGLRRRDIVDILEKAVIEGVVTKYTGEPTPEIVTSSPNGQDRPKPQRDFSHRVENSQKTLISLGQDVGSLREQVKLLSEYITDLEIELKKVRETKKEENPLDKILQVIAQSVSSVEIEKVVIKKREEVKSSLFVAGKYERF